jgi:hypothetical protein
MSTQHTPGPWKVMADPIKAGRDPFHDYRYIATSDTMVDFSDVDALSTDEQNEKEWTLESGELICAMRDCVGTQQANARLIASAPELLNLVVNVLPAMVKIDPEGQWVKDARAAIAKATGGAS